MDDIEVGTVLVQCPACEVQIGVPITATLATGDDERQYLRCESDMADLWAHNWMHEPA